MKTKGPVWALGAMSGTSLDGVDAAMILTDGIRILEFGASGYRPYGDADRDVIRAAFGAEPGDASVAPAAEAVERVHAELLSEFPEAEIIGFHGQTLAHAPDRGWTHQAGNGQLLAEVLSRPVVWDFRTADVELGGQGAPLAPFYHFACAKFAGATGPVGVLNLGGVGNLTVVDPSAERPDADGALLAFDTGPANALLDDLIFRRRGDRFDRNGALAASGQADEGIVAAALSKRYFSKLPPKSLDRDDFSDLLQVVETLEDADAAATLAAVTVGSVQRAVEHTGAGLAETWVTGGGRKNGYLMRELQSALPCRVVSIDEKGFDGDMLEAQAFGFLAVRAARGLPTSAPGTTGVAAPVGGGQVSRPTVRMLPN